jgi:flavorubredoxin
MTVGAPGEHRGVMATSIHEIADGVFRLSTYLPDVEPRGTTVNQFLLTGREPMLVHTGPRRMFADVAEAAARLVDLADLRWITFGQVSADECGAVNSWLDAARGSTVLFNAAGCSTVLDDLCDRPPVVATEAPLDLGGHHLRTIATPHVPRAREAQVLFDEASGTLFCGDLFRQGGRAPALVHHVDLVGPALEAEDMLESTAVTARTAPTLTALAELEPRTLALLHGPAYAGDCRQALLDLAAAFQARLERTLGPTVISTRPA